MVVDPCPVVVETPEAARLVAGGEGLEPTVNPMAIPPPRAARTATTIPTRTTVLRRTVMNRGSLSTTKGYGSSGRSRHETFRIFDAAPCSTGRITTETPWEAAQRSQVAAVVDLEELVTEIVSGVGRRWSRSKT